MLPWELQRNADYLLGLIPRPGSRKPEEGNKVLSNINENLLRSLGQHSEPLTASLTLNFSQNRWGDFVFPIFTRIRGRQNPVRTLCCSAAPLPFSHFSHTAPFTGSERFTTKELKPVALSKQQALSVVSQGQVSSFMNIRQFIASALNSLCFNLRFELQTSWA